MNQWQNNKTDWDKEDHCNLYKYFWLYCPSERIEREGEKERKIEGEGGGEREMEIHM